MVHLSPLLLSSVQSLPIIQLAAISHCVRRSEMIREGWDQNHRERKITWVTTARQEISCAWLPFAGTHSCISLSSVQSLPIIQLAAISHCVRRSEMIREGWDQNHRERKITWVTTARPEMSWAWLPFVGTHFLVFRFLKFNHCQSIIQLAAIFHSVRHLERARTRTTGIGRLPELLQQDQKYHVHGSYLRAHTFLYLAFFSSIIANHTACHLIFHCGDMASNLRGHGPEPQGLEDSRSSYSKIRNIMSMAPHRGHMNILIPGQNGEHPIRG